MRKGINKATKEEKVAVDIMKKAMKDRKKLGLKIVGVRKA